MNRSKKRMTAKRLETKLGRLLERVTARHGGRVETFEDAGVLTKDCGFVLRFGHDEFELTIVHSR